MRTAESRLRIEPLDVGMGLRKQACDAIKRAIMDMDIYGHPEEIRLDERQLSEDLGVSRTPIREALSILEQDGFVRSIPRRGIVVVRKTKREIVEMITVWAAIESMAARIAATSAPRHEIAGLIGLVDAFAEDPSGHLTEYSDANMKFHKAIIRLGGIGLMSTLTDTLFIHMRAVRAVTMTQDNRAQRSVFDHRAIIAALRAGDPDLAERLVREHTLGLAAHVERFGDFLDQPPARPTAGWPDEFGFDKKRNGRNLTMSAPVPNKPAPYGATPATADDTIASERRGGNVSSGGHGTGGRG